MVKRILIILFSLVCVSVNAEVSSQVSQTEIYDDETLFLTVRVSPGGELDQRDIDALESLFTIEQTFRQESRQTVNGNTTSYTDHQFRLRPKQVGTLGIPNFRSGNEQSKPIFITVLDSTQRKDELAQDAVLLSAKLSDTEPYVNEPIQLTVELAYKIQFRQPSMNDVSVDDFDITVTNEEQTTTTINGQSYNLYRRTLELLPKNPGLFTLPDVRFSAEYPNANLGRYVKFSRKAEITPINVRSIPQNYPAGAFWLPLKSFLISDNLPQHSDVPTGEHTTWKITYQIDGQPATLLPDAIKTVESQLDSAIRLYRNPPDIQGNQRIDTVALSFLKPGDYQLPEIKIPWWNVESEQLEYAVLPAKTFMVTGSVPSVSPTSSTAQITAPTETPALVKSTQATSQSGSLFWIILAVVSSIGWMATTIAWLFFAKRQKLTLRPSSEDAQPLREPRSAASLYQQYLTLARQHSDKDQWLSERLSDEERRALENFERQLIVEQKEPESLTPLRKIIRKLDRPEQTTRQTSVLDLYS